MVPLDCAATLLKTGCMEPIAGNQRLQSLNSLMNMSRLPYTLIKSRVEIDAGNFS